MGSLNSGRAYWNERAKLPQPLSSGIACAIVFWYRSFSTPPWMADSPVSHEFSYIRLIINSGGRTEAMIEEIKYGSENSIGKTANNNEMFENDNSNDREQLIEKLRAKGLPASEFDSGGGILHVIVPLLRSSERGLEIHTQDSELRIELERALEYNPSIPTCSLPPIICERPVKLG